MPIDPTSLRGPSATPAGTQHAGASMGKDQFLKLFVAQLKYQDPMNPASNTEFMGQLAQYSAVEQTSNVAKSLAAVATSLSLSQSITLIGRTVTYTDAAGGTRSGVVERVSTSKEGAPRLTVGGTDGVDPTTITQVA